MSRGLERKRKAEELRDDRQRNVTARKRIDYPGFRPLPDGNKSSFPESVTIYVFSRPVIGLATKRGGPCLVK
jgi:hypothetical protein